MEIAPCQTCRARHFDCDKAQPSCRRCAEAGRTCVPAFNVRFKKYRRSPESSIRRGSSSKFSRDQAWMDTPSTLSFVNETPTCNDERVQSSPLLQKQQRGALATTGIYEDGEDDTEHTRITRLSHFRICNAEEATDMNDGQLPDTSNHSLSIDGLFGHVQQPTPSPRLSQASLSPSMATPQSLYIDPHKITIIDRRGAELLQYFRSNIGHVWFDVTDSDFTTEALRLAPTCPILLYSLLAISCIHKSRVSTDLHDAEECAQEADAYHGKCVTLLLPMLSDDRVITDGTFLACSSILRFYEELSAPVHGRDDSHDTRHLLGGYACVEEFHKQGIPWDGLRRAALWTHQRQDAFNAVLNQRVPKTPVDDLGIDRTCSPADECIWAKRATCLNAETVRFCFGNEVSAERFDDIDHKLKQWYGCKPDTFTPVLYEERDVTKGQYFPHVPMLLDCCVVGITYHYFSMLLMTVHDPKIPKFGPTYLEAQRRIKDRIMDYIRLLCGLACSNSIPPARVVTCLAISQFGIWVTDRAEQEAVIAVLKMTEREDAWPTLEIENTLTTQWNNVD